MRISRLVTKERIERSIQEAIENHFEDYYAMLEFEKAEMVVELTDAIYQVLTELDTDEDLGQTQIPEEDQL